MTTQQSYIHFCSIRNIDTYRVIKEMLEYKITHATTLKYIYDNYTGNASKVIREMIAGHPNTSEELKMMYRLEQ